MSTAPLRALMFCEFLVLCLASTSARRLPIDKRSTRISRMPLYYGKRSAAAALADDLPPTQYRPDRAGSFNGAASRSRAVQDKQSAHGLLMNGLTASENHPSRILRILSNYYHSKNQVPVQEYPGQRADGKRAFNTLSRMPGFYGKRSSIRFDKSDDLKLFEEYRKGKSLFVQPHMPVLHGNRAQTYSSWNDFKPQDNIKRNSLSRMPGFFGKRAYSYVESESTDGDAMNTHTGDLKTHGKSHIPRLYTIASRLLSGDSTKLSNTGSSIVNQPGTSETKSEEITEKQLGQDSPKFITDNTGDNTGDEKHVTSKYKDVDVNPLRDDTNSPLTEDTNVKFNKRRYLSTLDRMPHFFGKREAARFVNIPDVVRNIYNKQKDENSNSNELHSYKLANQLVQQSDNLEDSLNINEPLHQSTGQHTSNRIHKIFDIRPDTKLSAMLHSRT